MAKQRLDPRVQAALRRLAADGWTRRQLAAYVGLSASTVTYAVNEEARIKRVETSKQRYEANRESELERKREFYRNNKEVISARAKQHYRENSQEIRERVSRYYRANTAKCAALILKRKRRLKEATPPWLSEDHWVEMNALYREARKLSSETGIKHEVDHVHPLQGKTLCGLNVPWNLQILTQKNNRSKSNRLEQ